MGTFFLAFFCGVVAWYMSWYFGMTVLGCVAFFLIRYRFFEHHVLDRWSLSRLGYFFLLIFFGFSCGFVRSGWVMMRQDDIVRGVVDRGVVILVGELNRDPDDAGYGQRVILSVDEIGDIEIIVPSDIEFWRGDRMSVRGKVSQKERYGRTYLTMSSPEVVFIGSPVGFFGKIATARRYFAVRMQELFPASVGAFMVGILAGGERGLQDEVKGDFRRTGLSHILAVSGYNVSLLLSLGVAIIPVRRRWRFAVFGFLLMVFIGFVGFQASAVRAAIMGFLGVWAAGLARVKDITLILLWSAFVMVFLEPTMLLYDKGFQLSFFATIGVIYISPVVRKWFPENSNEKTGAKNGPEHANTFTSLLVESFAGTLSVYIALLPVTMSFGKLPLIGLITNLLFVWFIPIAMTIGAGVFLLSFLMYPLAFVLARVVSMFVSWYFVAIHFFSWLPFSVFEVPPMSSYVVVGYYAIIAWWICRGSIKMARKDIT